ncbi:hypothetical protein HYU07_00395 [Candidatus Woesearchaeota archaeon]|nr:hypothetical protein [Candidatus Woesearchaeota archaeon]
MGIYESIALVAPLYNLAFVTILLVLFYNLFRIPNKLIFQKPWQLLFIVVLIFVVEEIMTVLRSLGVFSFPSFIFPIFEMVMIALFIYMVLLQKEYVKGLKK